MVVTRVSCNTSDVSNTVTNHLVTNHLIHFTHFVKK